MDTGKREECSFTKRTRDPNNSKKKKKVGLNVFSLPLQYRFFGVETAQPWGCTVMMMLLEPHDGCASCGLVRGAFSVGPAGGGCVRHKWKSRSNDCRTSFLLCFCHVTPGKSGVVSPVLSSLRTVLRMHTSYSTWYIGPFITSSDLFLSVQCSISVPGIDRPCSCRNIRLTDEGPALPALKGIWSLVRGDFQIY